MQCQTSFCQWLWLTKTSIVAAQVSQLKIHTKEGKNQETQVHTNGCPSDTFQNGFVGLPIGFGIFQLHESDVRNHER